MLSTVLATELIKDIKKGLFDLGFFFPYGTHGGAYVCKTLIYINDSNIWGMSEK